ncbi:MAG: hypothetical protein QM802_19735 [Agriterribacter sp.]
MIRFSLVVVMFIAFQLSIFSQSKYIKGQVKLLNSPTYVQGLNVKASYNKADFTDVTKSDGIFLLSLPGTADKVKEIQLINNQYEIVEKEDVSDLNTVDDLTRKPELILVCKLGELKKLSDKYYETILVKERQKFDRRLDSLSAVSKDNKREKDRIENDFNILKGTTRQQADFYSKFDLSDPLYKEAYEHFLKGEFQSCLEALPSDQVITATASSVQAAQKKIIRINLLKANAYQGMREYEQADKYFMEAIAVDKLNLPSYISFASAVYVRGDNARAQKYRTLALTIAETFDSENLEFLSSNERLVANTFDYMRKYDSAVLFAQKTLVHLGKMMNTDEGRNNGTLSRMADMNHLIGLDYCYYLNKKKEAEDYLRQAASIKKQLISNDISTVISYYETCTHLSEYFAGKDMYDSAYAYISSAYREVQLRIKDWPDNKIRDAFECFYDLFDLLEDMEDEPSLMQKFIKNQLSFYEPIGKSDKRYAFFLAEIYDYLFDNREMQFDKKDYNTAKMLEYYGEIVFNNKDYFGEPNADYFASPLKDVYMYLSVRTPKGKDYKESLEYGNKYVAIVRYILADKIKWLSDPRKSGDAFLDEGTLNILFDNFGALKAEYLEKKQADSVVLYYERLRDFCLNRTNISLDEEKRKEFLSSTYYALSFYYLFVNRYKESLQCVQQCLDIAPGKQSILTNKALALVLLNRFNDAMDIYKKYKDLQMPGRENKWKDVFIKDIEDLKTYGISHNDFPRVIDFLKN